MWTKDAVLDKLSSAHDGRIELFSGQPIDTLDFSGYVFDYPVNFCGAIFTEKVDFSGAIFKKRASFDEASFNKKASFNFSRFAGSAGFSKVHFRDEVDFLACSFTGSTRFWRSYFHKSANFQQLNGLPGEWHRGDVDPEMNFSWSLFYEDATFSLARIYVPCYFWRTRFQGKVLIDECIFTDKFLAGGKQTDVLIPRFGKLAPKVISALEERGIVCPDTESYIKYKDKWVSEHVMFPNIVSAEHLSEKLNCLGNTISESDREQLIHLWQEGAKKMFADGTVVSFRNTLFEKMSDVRFMYVNLKNVFFDGAVTGSEEQKSQFQTACKSQTFDVFISHASEDKQELAHPLAEKLEEMGLVVWYDESEIEIGQSLHDSINAGLEKAKYGIVILSPSFFAKNWTQYELDILSKRNTEGKSVILPIWHKVTANIVNEHAPSLADVRAIDSSKYTHEELALELAKLMRAKS